MDKIGFPASSWSQMMGNWHPITAHAWSVGLPIEQIKHEQSGVRGLWSASCLKWDYAAPLWMGNFLCWRHLCFKTASHEMI